MSRLGATEHPISDPYGDRSPLGHRHNADGAVRLRLRLRLRQRDASDFERIGCLTEKSGLVRVGRVGDADARFVAVRALIDLAMDQWRSSARG